MSFPVYIDGNTFTPAQQEDFSGRALAAVKAVVDEHEGMIARGTEDKGGLKHFVASAPAEKEGGLFAALEKCPWVAECGDAPAAPVVQEVAPEPEPESLLELFAPKKKPGNDVAIEIKFRHVQPLREFGLSANRPLAILKRTLDRYGVKELEPLSADDGRQRKSAAHKKVLSTFFAKAACPAVAAGLVEALATCKQAVEKAYVVQETVVRPSRAAGQGRG